jgi:hypothetical protein
MVSNNQRALWTFLIYALVGPFFAALGVVIGIALAWAFNISSVLPVEVSSIGHAGLATFVWSTLPALLTAVILAGVVWRTGSFNWLVAVVVAVIAFAIASVLLPLGLDHARPYLAFLAGIVATLVRQVLVQADIIVD